MGTAVLSYTLTAGSAENVGHVQANFEALRDVINGQLDSNNFSASATPTFASLTLTSSGKTALALTSTGSNTGITLGGDVTLYRSAADVAKTDDSLHIGAGLQLTGGSSTFLARSATAASTSIVGFRAAADTVDRFTIRADGLLSWGDGSAAVDVLLYRTVANVLKCDDQLQAVGGLTTAVKSGAPTDADTALDADGTLFVDTTNNRLYARSGGTWRYAALT